MTAILDFLLAAALWGLAAFFGLMVFACAELAHERPEDRAWYRWAGLGSVGAAFVCVRLA